MDFLGAVIERLGTTLGALVGSALFVFTLGVLKLIWQAWQNFRTFIGSRRRALDAVAGKSNGVWLTSPIEAPKDYQWKVSASKILAVANFKGGVGKTTLAANIGAYLAKEWQLRVLLIDLDFQGSLSSMAFPNGEWLPPSKQDSLATKLISGDIGSELIPDISKNVQLTSDDGTEVGQLAIIPSFYDLAQAENRILIEWLLNVPQKQSIIRTLLEKFGFTRVKLTDARYTLAQILHSESVQKAYDLVILDCPPRLSTGAVQAFCASSHLLIPTIFDRPSGEAVVSFHEEIETLKRGGICSELKYLGVVGTKWNGNQTNPRKWLDQMTTLLSGTELKVLSEDKFLPEAAAIVKYADEGIAYLAVPAVRNNASVRDRIGNLATYVAHRMGIPRPHDVTSVAAQ